MTVQEPSPQTTLVVLLGASEWPQFPEFQSSEAFANAARELKAYFLDSQQFGLPVENLLDLFDSNHGPNELDVEVGRFFEQRMTAMKTAGNVARDVLLYFVGHGGFVGRDYDFYLAIRCTRMENPPPDQSEGDVADIPFFPNLAVKASAVMPTPDGRQKIEEQQRVVRSQEETAVAGSSFIDTLQQLGLDKAALQRLRSNTPMALDARLIAEADNQEFDLSGKDNVLIGREDAVANIFPDVDLTPHGGKKGGVDRAHARIFVENGQYMLEDENSTNFTFLNRQRLASITPTPLHHNDEIRLGRVLLRFLKG